MPIITLRHAVLMLTACLSISSCSTPPPPAPPPPPATKPGTVIGGFKLQRNAAGVVVSARPMSASETQEAIRRQKAGGSGSDTIQVKRQ